MSPRCCRSSRCQRWCTSSSDIVVPVEFGRQLVTQIPGARYIEYSEGDHGFWTGDTETLVGDIEEFPHRSQGPGSADLERILATVMFTDIVDSTGKPPVRRSALAESTRSARRARASDHLASPRGTGEVDGRWCARHLDGPGRAIRCALSFSSATHRDWIARAHRSAYRRNRAARQRHRGHRGPCSGPRNGAISA